ncbi:MAG: hypothetical protein P8X73_13815 [Ignavibacteriaceae bacterium]
MDTLNKKHYLTMLKYGLGFLVFLLFSFTLSAQPGIQKELAILALQASGVDYTPFLDYEISWLLICSK